MSILAFYAFDLSWGMFDVLHVNFLLYPLTVAYFVAMALVVYYWSKFVMGYLGEKNFIYKALKRSRRILSETAGDSV